MKRFICRFVSLLLLACGPVALAHAASPDDRHGVPVLDEWVTSIEQLVVPAADAMPEDKYSYAPTNGEFKGVRTFAEQVKHLAAANYQLGARILGEEPPVGTRNEAAPDSVKTKADIMEYLKGSFACLHRAAAAIDEKSVLMSIKGASGTWHQTRLGMLVDALTHASDHYGQMVEYLRMNGIVPPESR
ncbi:MAG TPA: DinB family protein [Candidatus Angelobacter sp.]|nr:DinB family protein [Candidatus Angelobacter sp.]